MKNDEKLIANLHSKELESYVFPGTLGLEKENLRVNNTQISNSDHPVLLGSPLTNEYITTDFSESQIELVTPPFDQISKTLDFLGCLNEFVIKNIGHESLWCSSMPPYIESQDDIRIAKYGDSNQAAFKEIYRSGLSHRYGNLMQTISGIHYNYSLSNNFLELFDGNNSEFELNSMIYFRALRNLRRFNWLILYLFGASPVVTKNFSEGHEINFKSEKDFFYLPYSTSLRMSSVGYQNKKRSQLSISLNSLGEFLDDLELATNTKSKNFSKIYESTNHLWPQLNANLLQIEAEFYETVRPKSKYEKFKKLSQNLKSKGVDYIEIRSIDIDPYTPTGISLETLQILECLFIYSVLIESPEISEQEVSEIKSNEHLVALQGRKPNLALMRNGKKILLKDWAEDILSDIEPIANKLGLPRSIVNSIRAKINDPRLTISGKIMSDLLDGNLGFHDMVSNHSEKHKKFYLDLSEKENLYWSILEDEAIESNIRKDQIEKNDNQTLDAFLESYFSERAE